MAKRDKTTRLLGSMKEKRTPIAPGMFLPDTSGDHVRSIKRAAPVDDKDLVNKEYVDSFSPLVIYHPHQDVRTTAGPNFAAETTIMGQPIKSDNATNLFIGEGAGDNNAVSGADGVRNMFLGPGTGNKNSSGSFNTAIGTDALYYNSTGDNNVCIGYTAGQGVTGFSHLSNVFIGVAAAFSIRTGNYNIAIGQAAGYSNQTGQQNTYIGYAAGQGAAGQSNTGNTFIGRFSGLRIQTGDYNTGVGLDALFDITTGDNNVCLGSKSGDNLTTGSGNIIIGYDLNASAVGVNNELNIGGAIHGDTSTKDVWFEKSKMTAIGGFAIKLTNTTGANTVQGNVVRTDTNTDDAVILAGDSGDDAIGVFLDGGVADDAEAWVVISGIADVLADDNGFARGDRLITSGAVDTIASATTNNAPAVAVHFQEIGHAIETAAANTLGRVVLHFN